MIKNLSWSIISGKEDATNNFSRTYYNIGINIVNLCLYKIRKLGDQSIGIIVYKAVFGSRLGFSFLKDFQSIMQRSLWSFWASFFLPKFLPQSFS